MPKPTIREEAILSAIRDCAPYNMELNHDGKEDREAAAYVEGVHAAYDAVSKLLGI